MTKRSGQSAHCVIPIRGVTAISMARRSTRLAYGERAAGDVDAVVGSCDRQRQRQFAGAVGQVFGLSRRRAPLPHQLDSCNRFQRANQHAARRAFGLGHQVEALVHAVDEVDVGVAGRAEDHAGAIGQAARGMRRQVVPAQVGFGLDDDARGAPVHQDLAQQVARNVYGGPQVEGSWKDRTPGMRHRFMLGDV